MDTNCTKLYSWKQTEDDVQVRFPLSSEVTINDLEIEVKELNISIKCKEEKLLEGNLFHAIDNDLTTWSVNEQR